MLTTPLVSVIIPTYNRADQLENALRSVLAQTYPHWQLLVVDDGSTDDTRARVAAFGQAHGVPIEYHYQANQRQAAARNTGLRHCRGEYVASLDSDDTWHPDFLAVSVAELEQRQLDLVFLNWTGTYDTAGFEPFYAQPAARRAYCTQPDGEWWLLSSAQLRQLVTETCPAPSSAMVLRRTAMGEGWNQQMRIADDWCLLLDVALRQPRRAAFTLMPHWGKHVHDTNIYDGRFDIGLVRDLGLHDEPLMAERFRQQLKPSERRQFRRRIAKHHFNFMCLNRVENPGLASTAQHGLRALILDPLATIRAFFERGALLLGKAEAAG
jgi:glycosyltransferase involved in cell wall biosynthesis